MVFCKFLKLNENKTKIIKFERDILKTDEDLKISKFLDIFTDKNPNFSSHMETLSKKLNSAGFSLQVRKYNVNYEKFNFSVFQNVII